MSTEAPGLLQKYNSSCKCLASVNSPLPTLAKYAERNNLEGETLKLSNSVSDEVFARYKRHLRSGGMHQFHTFLLTKCTDLTDALKTNSYMKARNENERRAAITQWFGHLKASESKLDSKASTSMSMSMAETRNPTEEKQVVQNATKDNGISDRITNFYSSLSKSAAPLQNKKDTAKPVVIHNTTFVAPKKSNIVVQPPSKKTDESTKNDDGCCDDKFTQHIKNILENKHDKVPRKDLESLASHMESEMKTGKTNQDYAKVYARTVDLIHNGFDASNSDHLINALKIAKENNMQNLPKRERRALVDLILRGSSETLESLASQDSEGMQIVKDNAETIHKIADQDLLRLAPRLSAILTKCCPSKEKQTFVLGHNETPILRLLLNKNEEDKIAKYLQIRRLASSEVKKGALNTFAIGSSNGWDSALSSGEPFVSKDGLITIYASAPYSDDISYFRKWAKQSGCCDTKSAIWLAPTDETIVSKGIHEKAANWTPEDMKNFVMSHAVKATANFAGKLKKVAQGEKPWITNFKMANGKDAKAMIKTKIAIDQASDNIFVPVGTVLC